MTSALGTTIQQLIDDKKDTQTMTSYESQFAEAVNRTKSFGLPGVNFAPVPHTMLSTENMPKLSACLQRIMADLTPEDITAQCFGIHNAILSEVESVFGCEAYLTTGDIHLGGRWVFEVDVERIKALLATGVQIGTQVRLHTWITLPSMEIIDVTFPTSYGTLNNERELIGNVITGHADKLNGDLRYKPIILGDEFFERIGAMISF
jgi:hypothetical protein